MKLGKKDLKLKEWNKSSVDTSARNLVTIIVSCGILLMAGCAAIVECSATAYASEGAQSGYMFERVSFGIGDDVVVYDKDTKVMYVRYRGSYTVLVNADGTPRLYEEGE